ncbi:MAG: hypothetical protein ACKOC5_00355 [Chloroflexota bacterium]
MKRSDQKMLFGCLAACLVVLIVACCVCLALGLGTALYFTAAPTPTQTPGTSVQLQITALPPDPTQAAAAPDAAAALLTLEQAEVPVNDSLDLATRLNGLPNPQRALEAPRQTYRVGDRETFWLSNSDDDSNFQVEAALVYVSEHAYFWVEDGVDANQSQVEQLVDTFDRKIYPRNREFFGSEWTPGVDADPRLFIVYARGVGSSVAGYFSTIDAYLPEVRQYSNAHEMFVLSADHVELNEEFAYGVLAHEFQHMIHWYTDRNEETWMNEGLSDLAMFLNDYSIGGADRLYVQDPDIQLTDWPNNSDSHLPHYGASFLFLTYFLDRFGEEATKAVVASPDNGMVSIDKVLVELQAIDSQTGVPVSADDVFTDWTLASFIQDPDAGDGRYTYHNYPDAPNPGVTESVEDCSGQPLDRQVSQYGVDYISFGCSGSFKLRFSAPTTVDALPAGPHTGQYAFYSNRGDESDMTLTREFDFTSQSGPLSFTYWTWYDIEKDWDYLYLLASTDGQSWQFLKTPSGTDTNPVGNSYGWGYTGVSGGGPEWVQESVDLSAYAGKKVSLRFEYITDGAVNGEGFWLDDLEIPQIAYREGFEDGDGGWQAAGFVRIQNLLPQTYRLSLIYMGRRPRVEKIDLPAGNTIELPVSLDGDTRQVVLVVSGTARFTRQPALYQVSAVR